MSPHLHATSTLGTCKSEACRVLGEIPRERDGTGQHLSLHGRVLSWPLLC